MVKPCAERRPTRRRATPARHSRVPTGFTLLEAIVALSLFAIAGMAMYGLYNTNLISLTRVQDVAGQTPIARYAMERIAAVDPWREGGGRFVVDGYDIAWSATLVEPVRHGQNSAGTQMGFDFGLYEVEYEVSRQGRRVGVWRTRQVGFERVRGKEPGLDALGFGGVLGP